MATSGGFSNPCPDQPMTHAAVVALRDAGLLREECTYVVSDWTQGTTLPGPNLVELHAVAGNRLSMEAKVTTPSDQVAWVGQYDIDQGAVGTMQELRDNLGNVVRDAGDGVSVGAFPWGAANFTNNRITDSALTGWPAMTGTVNNNLIDRAAVDLSGAWTEFSGNVIQAAAAASAGPTVTLAGGSGARSFTGNTVRDGAGYRDNAGGTGTRTITDNEIVDGFFIDIQATTSGAIVFDGNRFHGAAVGTSLANSGPGARTIIRSIIQSANNSGFSGLGFSSGAAVTFTGAIFQGGRVQQGGPATLATLSITNSIIGCVINQPSTATGGSVGISGSHLYATNTAITQNGPGGISISNSLVGANIANSIGTARTLAIVASTIGVGQISQNRSASAGTGTDTIQNTRTEGGAVALVLAGTVDPGMNQLIMDRCNLSSGHTVSLTDPAGATILQRTEINSGATVTGTGTGAVINCRFSAGCTVALGSFSHTSLVIEGAFNKGLTASNTNRLCNKGFDDTI
ncbi:hypothetical protein GCM10010387_15550 [Streptomyces inusitatus]|uniref:Right handed beta helix domain-containing protein n=1 Tax=Streptomyces inusitatus TaxID=68221 RepID=A0A918PVJ3_9ACTN|nr:hypothetical protein [Streptomyces inusitatus]GGZ23315.1 hypothetical protein GCM10010387_15550 [Streptomyces inusitatus]